MSAYGFGKHGSSYAVLLDGMQMDGDGVNLFLTCY
jgi:hypothetical protein